jgi:hypothetical protein
MSLAAQSISNVTTRTSMPLRRSHSLATTPSVLGLKTLSLGKTSKEKDKHKWQKAQKIWLSERNISLKYWRCPKCLVRNHVEQGWDCSSCKSPCEEERVRIRQARGATMVDTTRYAYPYCGTCSGTGYVENSGAYELCPVCQPPIFDSGSIAGLPEMYSFEEPVEEDGVS